VRRGVRSRVRRGGGRGVRRNKKVDVNTKEED